MIASGLAGSSSRSRKADHEPHAQLRNDFVQLRLSRRHFAEGEFNGFSLAHA